MYDTLSLLKNQGCEGNPKTMKRSYVKYIFGLLNTGIGCYFYFSSIGNLPVQTVAICGYLEPLSAVFFSVLLLGERLLPSQILGAILILGGAVFGEQCKGGRKPTGISYKTVRNKGKM